MSNQYDMEPIWIEREDCQEMIIPKSPVTWKTEQLSLSEQMAIMVEQVRDAVRDQPSETALDVERGR